MFKPGARKPNMEKAFYFHISALIVNSFFISGKFWESIFAFYSRHIIPFTD